MGVIERLVIDFDFDADDMDPALDRFQHLRNPASGAYRSG
jgi:hypothetical protein